MHGVNSAARSTSCRGEGCLGSKHGQARQALPACGHACSSQLCCICILGQLHFVLMPRRLACMRPSSLMPGQSCSVRAESWRHNCNAGVGWEAGSICEGGWP